MTAGGYDPNQYPQGQQPYGQGGYPQGQQPYPQGGFPPPGPPQFGGPGGPGAPGSFTVGDAFNFALNKFKANPGPWIAASALIFVPVLLAYILIFAGSSTLGYLFYGLTFAISIVVVNSLVSGALREADGVKLGFDNLFQFRNLGQSILAYILFSVATSIGSCACGVGAFVVATFLMLSQYFVIDQNQDAITALKTSFDVVKNNAGNFFVLSLAAVGVLLVGALLCGLGLLVAYPMAALMVAYAFRRTTGGQVV